MATMSSDNLKQAERFLADAYGDYEGVGQPLPTEMRIQAAQAAALIALVEKVEAQNEHLGFIRDHLDDIGTVLLNSAGPMGSINIRVLGA